MSRKMYAIYCERGSYSDYSRSNVFLVETEELAIKFTEAYNQIVKIIEQDFPIWQKEWQEAHPEPKYQLPEQLKLPPQPTPAPFLKGMNKKEKAAHPLQIFYKKQLEEWQTMSRQMQARHNAARLLSNQPHALWAAEASVAKENYLDRIRDMMVLNLGDDSVHDQVITSIKASWYDLSFSYDELEVVVSP